MLLALRGRVINLSFMSSSAPYFSDSRMMSDAAFTTTRWTLVRSAADQCLPESALALERLCRNFWYPLYSFVRRQGYAVHDAQDLTQEFFSRLLESDGIGSVHPDKGRFRTFLIASLNHFLINEWRHSRRQKRGGGQIHFSLEAESAESRYRYEPADYFTPEKAFDRRWAETLLQHVLDRLQEEWNQRHLAGHFEDMKPFLADGPGTIRIADAAARLGVTEDSFKWSLRKFRQRYRAIFCEEITHTVSSPDEIDDEIRYLFSVLAE